MGYSKQCCSLFSLVLLLVACVNGEDPYRFYTWKVTYGDIFPLGVKQQVYFIFILLLHMNEMNICTHYGV